MTAPEDRVQGWADAGRAATVKGPLAVALAGLTGLIDVVSLRWLWVRWKNKPEAIRELGRLVAEHEGHTHAYWAELIGRTKRIEFTTAAGTWYQATVEPVWDDKVGGAIRVLVNLDDGGPSAFFPMTDALLVAKPDESAGQQPNAPDERVLCSTPPHRR